MAASLKFFPGSTIRWHTRRYVVIDCIGLKAIIARESGKRQLERVPVNEAEADCSAHPFWAPPNLVSVPAAEWQVAVKRFKILKPLLNMEQSRRTAADVKRAARVLGKHPVTVYRWLENYRRCERLSVFLRKERSDRGSSRLSNKVEKIIAAAIKNIYLTAEKPSMVAVTEEVSLQCFKNDIKKKPAPRSRYCPMEMPA
jgi:putative transposase